MEFEAEPGSSLDKFRKFVRGAPIEPELNVTINVIEGTSKSKKPHSELK